MIVYPYGQLPDAYLNVKQAAKEPWRGITAWVQGNPWLVVDHTDGVYTLENESGEIFITNAFEKWEPTTEHNALVAASRLEGSPFVAGEKAGNQEIGNLIYFNNEWNVRLADLDVALPIETLVERYDAVKWSKTADLYPGMDYRCPNCKSREVFDLPDGISMECPECGYVGHQMEFEDEVPDYDQDPRYDDLVASKQADFPPDPDLSGGGGTAFDYQLPPAGIHMRTHMMMSQAGLTARVHFPPGLEGMFGPIPEVLDVPSKNQAEVMAVMMLDNPEQYTVHVETPDDPEQVRAVFDKAGGRTAKVAEVENQENEPTIDTKEAVKCPNCGSHTIRAYSPEGNVATLVCLTCGTEFKRDVHINPEASVKESMGAIDPAIHAQILGLTQQIQTAYQQGNHQLAQQLNQQLQQLLDNPNVPLVNQPGTTVGSMEKGSPYPSDSYKNAPDHTPKGQKKWPKEVNAIYNACMREGNGKGDTKEEKESSCAAIAWAQYEKGKKSTINNDDLVDTTSNFFLESMIFEADAMYDGASDPYGGQTVDLNQYQADEPEDDRGLDYAHCPACDGPGVLLGQLGNRVHYRCRNCGVDFSHKTDTGDASTEFQGTMPYSASVEEAEEVNQHSIKTLKDSSGNDLVAGNMYVLHHPSYKVPDVVRILNLEDDRIEAAIASDEHGAFPIHITHDDSYSFDPYEQKTASGWSITSRANFSAEEQKELIDENPKGKARNFDKLKLDGTHYQVKEEATDPDFLLGW